MNLSSNASQQVALLTTKLYVPPIRPELVSRPRLIERMHESWHRKLTLISAPAGFGKTSLLAEWIRSTDRSVAWLSLDEDDNDPVRFFAYLLATLHRIDPDVGQTAQAMLQAPQPPPPVPLLTSVINDIAEKPQPFSLVLDDYHVIEAPPIHEALAFLLDHLPSHMHLFISTRVDPPLPIARLRARGQLTELRAADLRFTVEETTNFLNEVMELNLSAADVNALDVRTEGWVVGLQMAALSMRGRKDTSDFIKAFSGSHRFILDYLVGEVLEQQSGDVQEFLLKTSILKRLAASVCDAITDRDDSQAILAQLEQANLFLFPLDDERRWYRYHHLFIDLLRSRLEMTQPDQVLDLHRRASEWYEQNGLIAEAVGHALAAEDFERTTRLIDQSAWPMLTRGEMITLLGWLDALPDGVVRSQPRLSVLHAWALALTGQVDRVEPCLLGVDLQPIEGEVATVRAYVADLRGDLSQAIEFSHQALDLLPEENLFLRSIVALILGTGAYWTSGDPLASSQALAEAAALGQASDNVHLDVTATCTLGHVQMMQGQLHLAVETFDRAFQTALAGGKPPTLFVGLGHAGMAEVLYEWNDLDGAMRHARESVELGERGGSVDVLQGGYSYIPLAQLYQALGDGEKALQVLQKAEQFAQRCHQTHVKALVAAFRVRLRLAQGNLAAAFRWVQASQLMSTDEPEYEREFEHITLSRVLIAQGKPNEALKLLARLRKAAEAMGRMGRAIEILALRALAFQAQGEDDHALTILERALFLAEPEGFVRTFVDEGEPMARLLRRALSEGMAPNYVARLLAAFGQEVELMSPAMESLVEPLSEREQEVLRLVVAGLSNPEIAQELVIAVSTVKSHVNHIYGKLGVESRTQAVARARELGLL